MSVEVCGGVWDCSEAFGMCVGVFRLIAIKWILLWFVPMALYCILTSSVKTNFPPAEPPANYPANYPAKPSVATKSQYPAVTKHPVMAGGSAICQIFGQICPLIAQILLIFK